MVKYKKLLLSLIAGLLFPLACAPYSIWLMAYLSTFLLLYSLEDSTPNYAFLFGLIYGIANIGYGANWLNGIYEYTQNKWLPTIVWCIATIIYFALFYGFWTYIYIKFFNKNQLNTLLAFPIIGLLCEWLRALVFPWLMYGYSQIDSPLSSLIPIIGTYGLSFIVLMLSAAIYLYLKKTFIVNTLIILAVASLAVYCQKLEFININLEKFSTVGVYQTNIKPLEKSQYRDNPQGIWSLYADLVEQNLDKDFIVFPEYSMPVELKKLTEFLDFLNTLGKQHQIAIISGIIKEHKGLEKQSDGSYILGEYLNGLIVSGAGSGEYYKRRLVPFGEYVPFYKILGPILKKMGAPMHAMIPSFSRQLITIRNLKIIPSICYDIAFTDLIREPIKAYNAHIVINISENYWFKGCWVANQQLEIARMRALENGVYVIICSNSGLSSIIDHQGRIIKQAPDNTRTIISDKLYELSGQTPWTKIGQWPILFLLLTILIIIKIYDFLNLHPRNSNVAICA